MEPFNTNINVRTHRPVKAAFYDRCRLLGVSNQTMLREIIEAFNEGRLLIHPKEGQHLTIKGVHNVD